MSCRNPILPTAAVIDDEIKKLAAICADASRSRSTRDRARDEINTILLKSLSCQQLNPELVENYRVDLLRLNLRALRKLNLSQELSGSVQAQISCLVQSILNHSGKVSRGLTDRERFKTYLPEVEQIGDASVEGYALNASNLFVIKAPRDPRHDEIAHEAVIGYYLNVLRRIIPNFMYVYGLTKCSPPVLKNKEPVTWCSSNNPASSYLILERIANAKSLGDFIVSNVSAIQVRQVLLQVINALNVAHRVYGYTHHDLHSGNVLVRKLPRKVVQTIYLPNGEVRYLEDDNLAVIIDYGYSRIRVGGVSLGKLGLEFAQVDSQRSFPLYDIYKLCGFLGEALYRQGAMANREKVAIVNELFAYFGEGNIINRVLNRFKNIKAGISDYYTLTESYRNTNLEQYLQWLLSTYPIWTSNLVRSKQELSGAIMTYEQFTSCDMVKLLQSKSLNNNIAKYCMALADIYADEELTSTQKSQLIAQLPIDVDQAYKLMVEQIISTMRLIEGGVPRLDVLKKVTVESLKSYEEQLLAVLTYKERLQRLVKNTKAIRCASSYRRETDRFRDFLLYVVNFIEQGQRDYAQIKELAESNREKLLQAYKNTSLGLAGRIREVLNETLAL